METSNYNIVVINECDSLNVGDRAIAGGLAKAMPAGVQLSFISLERSNLYARFSDLSREWLATDGRVVKRPRPVLLRRMFLPVWLIRQFSRIVRVSYGMRASWAVIGGGGVIMNNNYHFALTFALWALVLKIRRIPFSILSVSTSGSLDLLCRLLFKYALRRAETVYARDPISALNMKNWLDIQCEISPDMAFGWEMRQSRATGRSKIGVNVTSRTHNFTACQYEVYLAELAVFIDMQSSEVVLFSTGEPQDEDALRRVEAQLAEPTRSRVTIAPRPNTPNDLLAILGECRTSICSRMHAAVLSIIAECQPLMIAIDDKAIGLMTCLGVSDCLIEFEDGSKLSNRLFLGMEGLISPESLEMIAVGQRQELSALLCRNFRT